MNSELKGLDFPDEELWNGGLPELDPGRGLEDYEDIDGERRDGLDDRDDEDDILDREISPIGDGLTGDSVPYDEEVPEPEGTIHEEHTEIIEHGGDESDPYSLVDGDTPVFHFA